MHVWKEVLRLGEAADACEQAARDAKAACEAFIDKCVPGDEGGAGPTGAIGPTGATGSSGLSPDCAFGIGCGRNTLIQAFSQGSLLSSLTFRNACSPHHIFDGTLECLAERADGSFIPFGTFPVETTRIPPDPSMHGEGVAVRVIPCPAIDGDENRRSDFPITVRCRYTCVQVGNAVDMQETTTLEIQ